MFPDDDVLFQFHKGSIRTEWLAMLRANPYSFQFHKGSIRTRVVLAHRRDHLGFNSIKVQLEQSVKF